MAKVNVGLIGAGGIGSDHAKSLRLSEQVGELTVFDVDPQRAAALAEKHEGRVAASEDELIDQADIVWLCTPPSFRIEAIRRVVKAGKPIFCEKPIALTEPQLEEIMGIMDDAQAPFFMGHSGRYPATFRRMVELTHDGTIGEPTLVWSTRLGYLDPATAPAWRLRDETSGGVVIELGVHEIDWAAWVGGPFAQVSAVGSSKSLAPGEYLDSFVALGTLESGINVSLNVSWADPRYVWQRGVTGTKGSLFFDDSKFDQIQLHRPGKDVEIITTEDWLHPDTGENMALRGQIEEVLAALKSGGEPPVTIDDGLHAIVTALAIYDEATGAS